jgi:beta-mannanase
MSRAELASRAEDPPRRRIYIWMAVSASLLLGLATWVLAATNPRPRAQLPPAAVVGPRVQASPVPLIPTKAQLLAVTAPRFGISSPHLPWSGSGFDQLADTAGKRPTMIEYFVNWTETYDPAPVQLAYAKGAVPVLSWEPWAGIRYGESQRAYALAKIYGGSYDSYITTFATKVRDAKWPVAIRLAHEMNGDWYPWSEQRSGNQEGEYIKAWRHVHDLFQKVQATNVIWVWSPNIVQPVADVDIESLYPGQSYVDWIGIVGYSVNETKAATVFDQTIKKIRTFTAKPLLITETGAQPGPDKASWTSDFFVWLARRTDVVGFIWFQYSMAEGGTADWRFDSDDRSLAAFKAGLAAARLADPLPTTS